jgi:hypothetical protein
MPSSGPLPLRSTQYEGMTIKQLVVQALLDHFHAGTTAPLLRDFMRNAYGRDVETGSLRPQLHRLKGEGVLVFDPNVEKWLLSPDKARAWSHSPPSAQRSAPELLKDEEPDPNYGRELLAFAEGRRANEPETEHPKDESSPQPPEPGTIRRRRIK